MVQTGALVGSQPRGISASRGAAILGVSPYQTQLQAWQTLMEERQPGWNAAHGYQPPEGIADRASIRWGLAFEDAVVELAEKAQGNRIGWREGYFVVPHKSNDAEITCHIDGAFDTRGGPNPPALFDTLHEGKTTTDWNLRENWGEPGTDKVPIQYQVQAQHQMLCTGAKRVIMSVLVFPKSPEDWEEMGWTLDADAGVMHHDEAIIEIAQWARNLALMGYFHQYVIEANPAAQATMLARYRRFWTDNVLGEREPAPEDTDDLRRLFHAPSGTLVVDEQTALYIAEIADITDEIGTGGPLAKRKEALKVEVIERARKSSRIMDDESVDCVIFVSPEGKRLAKWNGKTLTVNRIKKEKN